MIRMIGIVALLSPAETSAGPFGFPGWKPQDAIPISNSGISTEINSATGLLSNIQNVLTDERYEISDLTPFELVIDGEQVPPEHLALTSFSYGENPSFTFHSPGLEAVVNYRCDPQQRFIEKTLSIRNISQKTIRLDEIVPVHIKIKHNSLMVHSHYAPNNDMQWLINVFLRSEKGGLFLGVENPFFEMRRSFSWNFMLFYRPNWILQPGETFVSEPAFIGSYKKEGVYAFKELRQLQKLVHDQKDKLQILLSGAKAGPLSQRLEQEVLDWGEVWAMQEFIEAIQPERAWRKPYYYIRAIAPMNSLKDAKAFVDDMAELGHVPHMEWNSWIQIKDPDTPAVYISQEGGKPHFQPNKAWIELVAHTKKKGLVSSTCEAQPHPGYHAESDWLRVKSDKQLSNKSICFANQNFFKDYLEDYSKLVSKYELTMLAWDGGDYLFDPIFGYKCYAENHVHPAGDAPYYSWRNWMNLFDELHRRHPELSLRVAAGFQRGYPWILKELVDHHTDFYDYGPGASWWRSHNFYFIPACKCTTTIAAGNWNRLNYLFFRSMSIADHAMIWGVNLHYGTHGIPMKKDERQFFSKWLEWADKNIEYLRIRRDLFREPWGDDQVNSEHVDMEGNFPSDDPQIHGSAHCLKDRGFLFLFNPAKKVRVAAIPMNHWIGLSEGERFSVREIFPGKNESCGDFKRGEELKVPVDPQTFLLLEIRPSTGKSEGSRRKISGHAPVDKAFYQWNEIPWDDIMPQP